MQGTIAEIAEPAVVSITATNKRGSGWDSDAGASLFAPAVLLLLAVTVASPAAAQTYEEVLAAYQRGDYAAAYRGFRRLAEQGDAHAQANLGYLYETGKGVS